jgi:hypothetical protein
MITNTARFALLPVILLASAGSVSAKEQFMSADREPVQAMAAYTTRQTGNATPAVMLVYTSRLSIHNHPSSTGTDTLHLGCANEKTGRVRSNGPDHFTSRQGISGIIPDLAAINRVTS